MAEKIRPPRLRISRRIKKNSVFKTLDECWGLCLDLSEEYGHSEVWYGKCLMGEYRNGQ